MTSRLPIHFCAVLVLSAPAIIAQQSLFQTSTGDSSIFLSGRAGLASYNLGDSTARFDLARDPGNSGHKAYLAWGAGAGGTVKASAASVLNQNAPAPGGFVEGSLFIKQLAADFAGDGIKQCDTELNPDPKKHRDEGPAEVQRDCGGQTGTKTSSRILQADFLAVQFRYGRTQFYLLPSATPPVPAPTQTNFDQFTATIAYNSTYTFQPVDIRLGLAYGPGTANNLASLTQETYQSQVTTTSGSGQSILNAPSKSVYVGAYQSFTSHPINFDLVLQPKTFGYLVGVDVLARSELGGGSKNRYLSPGVGLFFFKTKSPVVPVGGIAFSYKQGKSNVALSAGWTFGGTQAKPVDDKGK